MMSAISLCIMIFLPISSWVVLQRYSSTSSNRCENGPCPTSCKSAASRRSCTISAWSMYPLPSNVSPASPAMCIAPSECSKRECCALGYTKCAPASCRILRRRWNAGLSMTSLSACENLIDLCTGSVISPENSIAFITIQEDLNFQLFPCYLHHFLVDLLLVL